MVLLHRSTHIFPTDFASVSRAFFNRYPNPYSPHVLSIDTISRKVDQEGNLRTTRLLKKSGKLPTWVKPFLRGITETWIIEVSVVNPGNSTMKTYTRNLDHTGIMKVEEYTTYQFDNATSSTIAESRVKFSSGFNMGIKSKVEDWSRTKFDENVKKSRMGMAFVIQKLEEARNPQF
ncbi:AHL_G0037030.mRNA.1.CDS.1 [Saccharomyces cerevisiae]|uniref:Ups1p n=1 Tax=Saccharomyces paradoxus TaxID=27291 RepID=A0A8B8UW68_SACPA|nr:Ups1 [Saccharomyces paradoxus]AJP40346.1 Ups1p [Saccharomyces cerevisiae YJM1078]AJV51188.1 Ups1p [Saccharomyces cerevisiae YJM1252]CAI4892439.1 AHL_G0037030.mRNA.1.CDS.1 [Saccharomyces cerevisiae]QHS74919.1 Ups1 [Saccharomyces paradoxus]CAI6807076.1 AHL_G0037030.mRNA.1.CDS.1 [Saccharomyces cerevisiae]